MEQTEEQKRNAYMAAGIPLPTITADSLTQRQTPINIPPQPMPTDALNVAKGAIATATYTTPNGTKVDAQGNVITETPKPTPSTTSTGDYSWIKEMLGLRPQPTSLVDERARLQEQEGVLAKQKEVDELNARLAPLQAEAQQIELQRAAIPEKITEANRGVLGMGGINVLSERELRKNYLQSLDVAVRTLPLTAQLNASQGRLESAKENVNQLLELTYKDQTAKLDWFDTMYDRLEGRLNKEQEERMQLRKEEIAKQREEADTLNQWKQFYAKSAMDNGDFKTATAIGSAKTIEEAQRLAGGMTVKEEAQELTYRELPDGRAVMMDSQGNIVKEVSVKPTVSGEGVVSPYQEERQFRTIQSVDELLLKARSSPGIFGRTAALPIPNALRSDAFRNFKSELDTLKSSIAFGELTAMREASKTGGALGQVSDREGKLLESALGALDMAQSPENFQKQLTKIKESIQRWQTSFNKQTTPQLSEEEQLMRMGYSPEQIQQIKNAK